MIKFKEPAKPSRKGLQSACIKSRFSSAQFSQQITNAASNSLLMHRDRRILYADDHHGSQMLLSMTLDELGLSKRLTLFSNGFEVVEYIEEMLKSISVSPDVVSEQPVSLLILDLNMPIMHGLEASQKVKELYDSHNKRSETKLARPIIVLCSQHNLMTFYYFITEEE